MFPKASPDAPSAPVKRLALDVAGAVDASGLSRAQLYKDMREGLLAAHKRGTRTLIFLDDLEAYLRSLPRAKFKPLEDADLKLKAAAEKTPEAEAKELSATA